MDYSNGLPKYEIMFILFLIFCSIVTVVVYDGYQSRTAQVFEEIVEAPPEVSTNINLKVFDRLQTMDP